MIDLYVGLTHIDRRHFLLIQGQKCQIYKYLSLFYLFKSAFFDRFRPTSLPLQHSPLKTYQLIPHNKVILLATSQLEDSDAFGSDPDGTTFYCSLVPFAASIVVSVVLLARMFTLIHRAAHGLAAAAKKTDTAMETFVDLRRWGILKHGEVGCLTHIAASRGMVRALDLLVRNGANPLSVDSTGQTPLQIAEQSGMMEARDYLEARISHESDAGGSEGLILSPLADRLRKKVSLARSPRSPAEREASRDDGAGHGGGDAPGPPLPAYGWRHVQKVARAAVRWVSKSERVLARRRRARVSVEPQAASTLSTAAAAAVDAAVAATAVDSEGGTPAQPAALLMLPPTLSVYFRPGGGHGSVETSLQTEDRNRCDTSRREENSEGLENSEGVKLSPSATTEDVPALPPEADVCREGYLGAHSSEEAATPRRRRTRRRTPDMVPDDDSVLLQGNGDLEVGDEAKAAESHFAAAATGGRDSWKNAEGRRREEEGEGVGERQEAVAGGGTGGEDEPGERKSGVDTLARGDGARGRLGGGSNAPEMGQYTGEVERNLKRVSSLTVNQRSSGTGSLSAAYPGFIRQPFPDGDTGAGNVGGVGTPASRSDDELATTVVDALTPARAPASFRRLQSSRVRSTSTLKTSPADGGANITYSPTQAVLNITWALRRLRPLGTPQERRAAFAGLRQSSPVHIPQMYLLAFLDLAVLGEIPRRTGDRFLGHASTRPVSVCELMARADESGDDPVVVYVSHRWLEPDFKNPDDHSKARFYQVIVMSDGTDAELFDCMAGLVRARVLRRGTGVVKVQQQHRSLCATRQRAKC